MCLAAGEVLLGVGVVRLNSPATSRMAALFSRVPAAAPPSPLPAVSSTNASREGKDPNGAGEDGRDGDFETTADHVFVFVSVAAEDWDCANAPESERVRPPGLSVALPRGAFSETPDDPFLPRSSPKTTPPRSAHSPATAISSLSSFSTRSSVSTPRSRDAAFAGSRKLDVKSPQNNRDASARSVGIAFKFSNARRFSGSCATPASSCASASVVSDRRELGLSNAHAPLPLSKGVSANSASTPRACRIKHVVPNTTSRSSSFSSPSLASSQISLTISSVASPSRPVRR